MGSLRKSIDRFLDDRAAAVPRATLPLAKRLEMLAQHGDFSLAYSTATQPLLSYFGDENGYVAFQTMMGRHYALADPVVGDADRAALICRFVEIADSPWFVQIGEATAKVLSGLGYQVSRIGYDTRLPLPAHDFSGKPNETVRYSERWLVKKGFTLAEDTGGLADADEVRRLSDEWRAGRIVARREMAFLNRPFPILPGPGMRRFVLLDPDGKLTALLDFDPISKDGKVTGYTTAFKRKLAGATPHAEIGLTKFAVDQFRKEGISAVTLGLSPLADMAPSGFPESTFWRGAFSKAFDSGLVNRHRFNLKGQAAFKRRFHGVEEPAYIAFKRGTASGMLALLRLLKAI